MPPVYPRARPAIIGTLTPDAATTAIRGKDILSPTPPVECLSTNISPLPLIAVRSITSPE